MTPLNTSFITSEVPSPCISRLLLVIFDIKACKGISIVKGMLIDSRFSLIEGVKGLFDRGINPVSHCRSVTALIDEEEQAKEGILAAASAINYHTYSLCALGPYMPPNFRHWGQSVTLQRGGKDKKKGGGRIRKREGTKKEKGGE